MTRTEAKAMAATFRRAAVWLEATDLPAPGCCFAISMGRGGYRAEAYFDSLFKPAHSSPDRYWWDVPDKLPRLLALDFAALTLERP
jgi:hypothetical protein